MKYLLKTYIAPIALVITVFSSNFLLLSVPKIAQAQSADSACTGGVAVAIAAYAWAKIKDSIGVPAAPGQAEQGLANNRQTASDFINKCVLRPLAQMMIVALIRNIGASVVNWVNTGFEGKPAFVTDFSGTLLDSADQAAGNFIEGTDLGFLCSPFSFQIRLALALKYSQPFQQQVRCTLSDISNNVSNFANNNGGAGWDNWLKLTTEPQNNVYGAFLIADSELAQRMANAVDVKEKRVAIGQGFLDYETCDRWETSAEVSARMAQSAGNAFKNSGSSFNADLSSQGAIASNLANYNAANGSSNGNSATFSDANLNSSSFSSGNSGSNSATPQCLVKSVKTPGQVIASKLNSTFTQGDIQAAVATEIDQVISATLNQLAQKAIQGANGLLGLSQRKQSGNTSYLAQYRAQYYGQNTTATVTDTGTQSPLDAYTVSSYDASAALRNDPNNPDIQGINQFTNTAGGAQIQAQNNQFNTTIASFGNATPETNVALGKSSNESSVLNSAANGNDGIKSANQYVPGAETSPSTAGGWWEVDLGGNAPIEKINIYPTQTSSAPNGGLGTFTVDIRDDGGAVTTYPASAFSQDSASGALTANVGKSARYIRVTRQDGAISCPQDYYGRTYGQSSCENQPHLAFAELEAMQKVDVSIPNTTATSSNSGSGSSTTPVTDSTTATSTLSWNPAVVSNITVNSSSGINQQIDLSAVKSVSGLVTEISLYDSSGRNIAFQSLFDNFDIFRGSGGAWASSQSAMTSTTGTLRVGLSINQNSSFSFKITGAKRAGATAGSYSFISKVSDSTGTVLEDKTQRINFVVE